MDLISRELGLSSANLFPTASSSLFTVVVHNNWLKKWLKNSEFDNTLNPVDFPLQIGEKVPYPWRKIFIKVLNKKVSKVLPLPRYKLNESSTECALTFSQLLQYVSQTNQRNLWKESYKKYCQNSESMKDSTIVSLLEHDQLLSEVLMRLYGCTIIRIRNDTGKTLEYKEIVTNKNALKSYETHVNLLAAMFILETDNNYFIVYRGHFEYSLLDCLNFSPKLIDKNYTRGLFLVHQLLNMLKAINDRGLSCGMLTLQDIYLSENLWLQVIPPVTNNVHCLDASLIYEQRNKVGGGQTVQKRSDDSLWRSDAVQLEKLCILWVKGRISNLDYLLHLNTLAGRKANDPQSNFLVPWVTDFASRCGRNWRDLTKSKYRLNKGDRQLDMTYEVGHCTDQIPHHVSDALSDITYYVYMARRTPREILCKHVRNNWVPAEYPASIQRMQEWTPDECIPEFYTDPTVFKSIHEDLPDLGLPTWATCAEDFITKHREALESTHVSENLHHWIDITFGYKLSGPASVRAKNVCLSLADGHTRLCRAGCVQLFPAPHAPRRQRAPHAAPPALRWLPARDLRKPLKSNESSDEFTEEEEESTSLPQHVSRLHVPQRVRSRRKSGSRARSLSKSQRTGLEETPTAETRASSHSRHYRVQKSELGKGVIYLPKEFNPVASIQALEVIENFRTKCFFNKSEDKEKHKDNLATLNLYPMQQDVRQDSVSMESKDGSDDTAFTNRMFLATFDQKYLKKFSQDAHEDAVKERKSRTFNNRYTTDASVYKQFVTDSRRRDMLVIGCLIVEIFLHQQMRTFRTINESFSERYNNCRTVLKYNFSALPKCVSYVTSLLLNVQPPSLSFKNELILKSKDECGKKVVITDKGLPPPTPAQLLQPLLMQHLIPFPQSFSVLYNLLGTLHEYELTSNELNILYTYDCDGHSCDNYKNVDKTKLAFKQKIAEGKIQACVTHLDALLNKVNCTNRFDELDIFLAHYIELLTNNDTSVLAAWYLFDSVSKALGPAETRNKLLKHILHLYEDDELAANGTDQRDYDVSTYSNASAASRQKFVKLYHNIFLLQLMVRLGLQCFLDNFTQHLVEAVGGYKDFTVEVGTPGHLCHNKELTNKKPRYSDDNVKSALASNSDIFSPDTSYGSEQIVTPNTEKVVVEIHQSKEKDADSRSENDLFHFETDKESGRSGRSKSPAESIESCSSAPAQESTVIQSTSPGDFSSPMTSKFFTPSMPKSSSYIKEEPITQTPKGPTSPTIDIPSKPMFTSYLHFAEDETIEQRKESHARQIKSLELTRNIDRTMHVSRSLNETEIQEFSDNNPCKISDMSSESLIWLAHRLGPVLTCRYITRNLLKMLTLCYIGKENLTACEVDEKDEFDEISIVNSRVVGDRNAAKVIKCLTSIVAMYGEQLIIFQYLPHMGELIASCRRRLTAPLEGGAVACLQLVKYLVPYMSDVKVMEQLQDTFLKSIVSPSLRLAGTARGACPSGAAGRAALCRKLLAALHALALRVGPEMTRRHICVPALQRFFLVFDKATGKTDNWPNPEETIERVPEGDSDTPAASCFVEIRRDGSTAEWAVRDGVVSRADLPDVACSPPASEPPPLTAQEELLLAFDDELAYRAYTNFAKLVGADALGRVLKNGDTIRTMCERYRLTHCVSSPLQIKDQSPEKRSLSDEPIHKKTIDIPSKAEPVMDHISSSNSFGSNVTLVGNRIDVSEEASPGHGFVAVQCKVDNAVRSSRHLRGDWLIYWEHEIGRPDKETSFNLKQIKLQTFVGHSHSVKSIHCLDNENSFMSGSKDKTVKLWSLRNQGDGNATTQCNWTYTGHKKGVLSLSFLESLRLAVSTDSVVHIWDPFMESVVSQLDNIKSPVSIVRALPGPSSSFVAATTDATLRVIDARACHQSYELKLPMSSSTFIRCMCVSPRGTWAACGLASGAVSVLDLRTGQPRAGWRAHDGEVLRLAAVDEQRLLSSGLDQVTALWRVDDGELIAHLKGSTEPVHCLAVYNDELISGTTNNRIAVHTALSPDASCSSTKLRSDSFKGVLTCMAVLPLNRLLLLASDNGSISLLC